MPRCAPCEVRHFDPRAQRAAPVIADTFGMQGSHPREAPFARALAAVTGHPDAAIVCALAGGARRQAELATLVKGLNEATLGDCLRELDGDGFIWRRVDPGPPLRVLYELTPQGETLATSLRALRDLAQR